MPLGETRNLSSGILVSLYSMRLLAADIDSIFFLVKLISVGIFIPGLHMGYLITVDTMIADYLELYMFLMKTKG